MGRNREKRKRKFRSPWLAFKVNTISKGKFETGSSFVVYSVCYDSVISVSVELVAIRSTSCDLNDILRPIRYGYVPLKVKSLRRKRLGSVESILSWQNIFPFEFLFSFNEVYFRSCDRTTVISCKIVGKFRVTRDIETNLNTEIGWFANEPRTLLSVTRKTRS